MLSFRLYLPDLCEPSWSWGEDRWITGESWIKPLINPALEWELACDNSRRACAVVQERRDSRSGRILGDVAVLDMPHAVGATDWSAVDYAMVEMRPGWVRVTSGLFGTAPLYLVEHADTLLGSWDLRDIRTHLHPGRLLDRAVVRALTRQHRYTSDTLFEGVHRLTERASATFTQGRLRIDYPAPAEHILQAREPRAGVDIVSVFDGLLKNAVAQTLTPAGGRVGLELSGGADSANVALALSETRGESVRSFGLVVGGLMGARQRDRRAAIAQRLGLIDTEISASKYPPFAPVGIRAIGLPHDPAGAYYREAFDALRDATAQRQTSVIFTGLGGDELNALHPYEQAEPQTSALPELIPWLGHRVRAALSDIDVNLAPVSAVPLPSLMAFSLHNPAYLEAGIWPVAPLAHPVIGRFAEQLPLHWRRGKAMFRQRLRRAGFSDEIADPNEPENFSALMQEGLRQFGLPLLKQMLRESILIDTGYLDHCALAEAYQAALQAETVPSLLCDVIAIERGLQSLA